MEDNDKRVILVTGGSNLGRRLMTAQLAAMASAGFNNVEVTSADKVRTDTHTSLVLDYDPMPASEGRKSTRGGMRNHPCKCGSGKNSNVAVGQSHKFIRSHITNSVQKKPIYSRKKTMNTKQLVKLNFRISMYECGGFYYAALHDHMQLGMNPITVVGENFTKAFSNMQSYVVDLLSGKSDEELIKYTPLDYSEKVDREYASKIIRDGEEQVFVGYYFVPYVRAVQVADVVINKSNDINDHLDAIQTVAMRCIDNGGFYANLYTTGTVEHRVVNCGISIAEAFLARTPYVKRLK